MIGINTAIFSPNGGSVGIGFAIPSNAAKIVLDQLRATGKVDRGYLGVEIQEVTPDIAASVGLDADHPIGALVATVRDDTPAAKAGIKVGDVIEKFDGKTVEKMRDLPRIVAESGSGKKVDITILRDGKTITVATTVGQNDETVVANAQGDEGEHANKMASLGLSLAPLNADARKRLGIQKNVDGVLISRVRDGSPAADGGVLAGDVIVKVNGQSVAKPDEVIDQVKGLKSSDSKSILLLLNRHGVNRFIALKPEEKNG